MARCYPALIVLTVRSLAQLILTPITDGALRQIEHARCH